MDEKINKTVFTSSAIFVFFSFSLRFILPLFDYKYPSKSVYIGASIVILALVCYCVIMYFYYKFNNKNIFKETIQKVIHAIMYIFHTIFVFIGMMEFLFFFVALYNGYSYTENIDNYLVLEWECENEVYFPEKITEDMKNPKYVYAFAKNDAYALEIFLETQFDDLDTMNYYLNESIEKVGINNLVLKTNEGNSNYMTYYLKDSFYIIENYDGNYSVYGQMFSISFDYESKTIVWSSIEFYEFFTDDYGIPAYFEKFNIELIDNFSFYSN